MTAHALGPGSEGNVAFVCLAMQIVPLKDCIGLFQARFVPTCDVRKPGRIPDENAARPAAIPQTGLLNHSLISPLRLHGIIQMRD
jgi:hypothetical protein